MNNEKMRKSKARSRRRIEPLIESVHEHTMLMFRAKKGDRTAYARIYEIYCSAIGHYFLSLNGHFSQHDLDDMTQEVFQRGWDKKEEFQGKSSVKTYLFAFAGNVYSEEQRRQNRRAKGTGGDNQCHFGTIEPQTYGPQKILERAELNQSLNKALSELPPDQQEMIYLSYYCGLSYKQASERLNCPEKAFECQLYRIRQKLRNTLKSKH